MKYGYTRCSTAKQEFIRQQYELSECGIPAENIFHEKISGTKSCLSRKEFERMINVLCAGDEVYFPAMSRMARSVADLIETTNLLVKKKKVVVHFLKENITVGEGGATMNAMTALLFNIMGAFAQFERDLISDRTKAGLDARRELLGEDFKIGHPKTIAEEKKAEARRLLSLGVSGKEVAKKLGMSEATISRLKKQYKGEKE